MKKAVFSSLLLFILIATSCKKSTTPTETDKIKAALTNFQPAYLAAADGAWIEITETEYNKLATTLTNVTRSGVTESDYTNLAPNSGSGLGTVTFAQNDGATMPAGSYLFAFKINIKEGTNTGAKVKISTVGVNTGFSDIGSVLPSHGIGEHYFVLKGNATPNASTGFLGYTLSENVRVNFKVIAGKGSYYYEFADVSTMVHHVTNDAVFLAQGLSTTVLQW